MLTSLVIVVLMFHTSKAANYIQLSRYTEGCFGQPVLIDSNLAVSPCSASNCADNPVLNAFYAKIEVCTFCFLNVRHL